LRACLKTLPPDSQCFDNLISLPIKYISRYVLDFEVYSKRQIVDDQFTLFLNEL